MKLAMVTAFPRDPSAPKGGVEAVSVVLARALAKLPRLQLDVVTCDAVAKQETYSVDGFTVHRLPRCGRSMLTGSIGADRKQVSKFVVNLRPDIVHSHDTYGLMVTGLDIPRVFTIHGFIYGDTRVSKQKLAWLRSKMWEHFEKKGWRDQPHIISISPYVRERLAGVTKASIHDIDNPISETLFETQHQPTAGRIFSAAVISPRKNTLSLVRAFALIANDFPHAVLRLAGPITNVAYGRELQEYIERSGLNSRVTLVGKVPTNAIRDELAAASVFGLVSLEENSPLGIEEAMAVGVPVVTSNRCGMPYMVRHGETGYLVDPFNVQDIARRLRSLLADPELSQAMSARSRQIARERFHPDAVAARTLAVYHDVLADRAKRSVGVGA